MRRTKAESMGDLLKAFYQDNPQIKQRILEYRLQRAWGEVLGEMVKQSTRSLYVKQGVLHVAVSSSVLRSELLLNKVRLVKGLNEYVGDEVIRDVVIR